MNNRHRRGKAKQSRMKPLYIPNTPLQLNGPGELASSHQYWSLSIPKVEDTTTPPWHRSRL